jgi:hypothetical protein
MSLRGRQLEAPTRSLEGKFRLGRGNPRGHVVLAACDLDFQLTDATQFSLIATHAVAQRETRTRERDAVIHVIAP